MVVASCELQVYVPDSRSLKDKRQVIKSLKDRLHSRFNISVAEVDYQDLWQRSTLGMAVVSAEASHAEEVLAQAVRFVEQDLRLQVLDCYIETL